MAEHPSPSSFEPHESEGPEAVPESGPVLDAPSTYLKFIDNTRKAVVIAMAVCGAGLVICVHREDYLVETLRRKPGIWTFGMWVFLIGVYTCLIATLALIVEHLARPAKATSFFLRSLFVRSLFILTTVVAIYLLMDTAYGPGQAIGAVISIFLLLAAMRAHNTACTVLAILAAIMLGLTLMSTQSTYQYALWHADEIVAAGCELMAQHPQSNTDYKIQPSDPGVPKILRKLGAGSIIVGKERVSVYIPGIPGTLYIPGLARAELIITPISATEIEPVWIKNIGKGGGDWKITDRLWMIVDD
jgi:hypothetical protein